MATGLTEGLSPWRGRSDEAGRALLGRCLQSQKNLVFL